MSALSDIALVAQVVALGNTRAFDQLVRKYQSQVRRFFLHQTCGDQQLSDDLAQETFIKAYTGLKGFGQLSSFSTWLYRIAYNVFYDYVRSQHTTESLDEVPAESLYRLKEIERTCITLRYMDDLPIDKIAQITGCPASTVKSHLSRAKDKLTTYLKQNGYD